MSKCLVKLSEIAEVQRESVNAQALTESQLIKTQISVKTLCDNSDRAINDLFRWFGQIEMISSCSETRKKLAYLRSSECIQTLIGGQEVWNNLRWDEIKNMLIEELPTMDPVDIVAKLMRDTWYGDLHPKIFVTNLRMQCNLYNKVVKLPVETNEILTLCLTDQMPTKNKQVWSDLLEDNFNKWFKAICTKFEDKGKWSFFDDESDDVCGNREGSENTKEEIQFTQATSPTNEEKYVAYNLSNKQERTKKVTKYRQVNSLPHKKSERISYVKPVKVSRNKNMDPQSSVINSVWSWFDLKIPMIAIMFLPLWY